MYNFFEVAICDLKRISWEMNDLAEKTEVNVPVIVNSTEDKIENLIHCVRGQQVMIDSDLAMLYNVETKRLNESVKRNSKRFPESFCF